MGVMKIIKSLIIITLLSSFGFGLQAGSKRDAPAPIHNTSPYGKKYFEAALEEKFNLAQVYIDQIERVALFCEAFRDKMIEAEKKGQSVDPEKFLKELARKMKMPENFPRDLELEKGLRKFVRSPFVGERATKMLEQSQAGVDLTDMGQALFNEIRTDIESAKEMGIDTRPYEKKLNIEFWGVFQRLVQVFIPEFELKQ